MEFVVDVPDEDAELFIARFGIEGTTLMGFRLMGEIVRCRDCRHYYEAEEYHPQGNYDRRCCKYFGTYDDEVESNGFCAWGTKKEACDE